MRILLIHQYFLGKEDAGGSRWNEMTKFWGDQGVKITVIAGMVHYATGQKNLRYKGKWTFKEKNFYNHVDVIRSHVSESYNKSFLGRLWAYFSFVFSSIYAGIFKAKGKYDLILVSSPPLFVGITAYVLSKLKRVPFVFEVRDLWPESAIDTGVVRNLLVIRFAYWFENFIYKKARMINVLTPAFRDILIEKKKVPAEKVITIPNAADFSLSDEIMSNFNANSFRRYLNIDDKFVITYVGAHGVANHLIQLLDAAALLKDTQVLFQLIGSGMEKNMLIEEANKRKLTNVKFIDSMPKEEVFKYILASDMGASVLKRVDTFKTIYSNKTFDYMACKKPVLMVIDGVSRDLIEKAGCGVYAEPENPEDIAAKIRNCLGQAELLKMQGNKGYLYAKKHFDRKVLSHRYLIQLRSII